jgi:hypothetical protein
MFVTKKPGEPSRESNMSPSILEQESEFQPLLDIIWGQVIRGTESLVAIPTFLHKKAEAFLKQTDLLKKAMSQFRIKGLRFVNGCIKFVRQKWWHRKPTVRYSDELPPAWYKTTEQIIPYYALP